MSGEASAIYTKTGDDGTTGRLFGGRLGKDDALVEACGDTDEAVAVLGTARQALRDEDGDAELADLVLRLQRELFVVGADLMTNPRARDRGTPGQSQVSPEMVDVLERTIDDLVARRPLRPVFIVPGATRASAALDVARTVVRRAERHTISAARAGAEVSDQVVVYLNRLSDLLFVLGRHAAGEVEEPPSHD
ncbi:cob(I)yrinic acid a,c-diamide adenosyltransferase [Ornithinimicrobium sp. F0845]|uniref:cob(I)yrinic acid a,c-diamide adenosyltransferase n=1 Tax=Ornithinimicrobium sp. F0845 TaxID=2926412 RepID=UPI001FF12F40|nr:cob(I)yrinic acid a,c-diamide adenosyltransferase [Ornithinimicrobium sp. F0845]MCK0112202.1 cob(I)yrinic acid a,c-diamide adenosyltransferase [Ornithinimicrobium sp. F0845]